jgi:hypothetical protein
MAFGKTDRAPATMIAKLKRTFTLTRLHRNVRCMLVLIAPSVMALAGIGVAIAVGGGVRLQAQCDPVILFTEFFDSVTPPALPLGWSSITWVTSNSGVPTPPANTPPNAASVDDPPTVSDKQLLSPNISLSARAVQILFSNNFNLQDGFDGGVLEVSFDNGITFQDILTAGGTFAQGGYNGTISACCGNPLAGRQAWTGNSGGFIQTKVNLPIPAGANVMLRWRMGSDSSGSGEGWRIDSVAVVGPCPRPPRVRPRPTPAPRPTP